MLANLNTRLTGKMNLKYPVIQAPMAIAAGGSLAATVSRAGGLGLIGGGYGDQPWLEEQFEIAGEAEIGCGLITWSLKEKPELLEFVLDKNPVALFLSFGDPSPFLNLVKAADVQLVCQIQTLLDAKHALDLGADVIVAQGAEAGGHGEKRATFTLVPEVADYMSTYHPDAVLCAAGGIADGRGLAAALMLGADGVVVGSRFWATREALVHPNMHKRAIEASGDLTIRSSVMDIARYLNWPPRYTARVLQNSFTDKWHDDIDGLLQVADDQSALWKAAWIEGNMDIANTFVGEAVGMINEIVSAEDCLKLMVEEANTLLNNKW